MRVEDASDYCYGIGTNPGGGGVVRLIAENEADEALLIELRRKGFGWYREVDRTLKVECREVRHDAGVPHDDGVNPKFLELIPIIRYPFAGYLSRCLPYVSEEDLKRHQAALERYLEHAKTDEKNAYWMVPSAEHYLKKFHRCAAWCRRQQR